MPPRVAHGPVSSPWPPTGEGEMIGLCRSFDWSRTPLGAVERWPEALRTTVRTCLESPFPTSLWCGPELTQIYDDAYRVILGAKHPAALGRSGREVWAEIWDGIGPMFERIRAGGTAVHAEDSRFVVERSGRRETRAFVSRTPGSASEERFLDFIHQPLDDSSTGERVGIVAHGSDVTEQVLARREVERLQRESEEALRALELSRTAAERAAVEAAEANRAKSDFPAAMSHELRTPLNADDAWVRVHVSDTGRGIGPAQLERVFDPFVQVDRHLTPTSQQGVGLGLAISRDLAHAMGGTLVVRSEPGRGSTFTLSLPWLGAAGGAA